MSIAQRIKSYQDDRSDVVLRKLLRENAIAIALTILAINLSSLVDSVMIGRFIQGTAMASYGLAKPVTSKLFWGIAGVVGSGCVMACARALGERRLDDANKIFSLAMTSAFAIGAVGAAVGISCSGALPWALGADETTYAETRNYLVGWFLGAPGYMVEVVLHQFVRLEGDSKNSLASAVTLSVVDIAGDFLSVFVFDGGMLGLALASTASAYASAAVLVVHFLGKHSVLKFQLQGMPWQKLGTLLVGGLPNAARSYSQMFSGILVNWVLVAAGGSVAVSAWSIWNSWSTYAALIESGGASAVMLIAGMLYGEHDERSIRELLFEARRFIMAVNVAAMALTFAAAPLIVRLFMGEVEAADAEVMATCLRICSLSLPFSALYSIITSYFQAIGHKPLANGTNILTCLVFMSGFAWLLGSLAGMAGIWASVAVSYLATLGALELVRRRLGLDRLFLPVGFEADPANIAELKVRSMDDVCTVSEEVMAFCRAHGLDARKTMALGVSAEELARNSVAYGFAKGGREVAVRMVCHDGGVTMRLRDDCPRFNPEEYSEFVNSDDPTANFGIRMVLGLADEVNYVPLLNRNCVYVKVAV